MSENDNSDDKLRSKDTRWDRIRKRHLNSLNVKSETVKKFFAMDFIDRQQLKSLSEDSCTKKVLDPVLVMDLRHEMIRKNGLRKGTVTMKDISLENIKVHNKSVEQHYIENELNKFKSKLERTRRRNDYRPKLCLNLNNGAIFESLERCNKHTIDFYKTVQNALREETEDTMEQTVEVSYITTKNNRQSVCETDTLNEKTVRFEESVEIINYSPRDDLLSEPFSSNTSSDVDSVVSDIVEDVVHEVQMEAQIELIGKSFEAMQKSTLDLRELTAIVNKPQDDFPTQDTRQILNSPVEPLQIKKIEPTEMRPAANEDSSVNESDETPTSKSSDTTSKEQQSIINELFAAKLQNNEKMLRKYFLRWTHAITITKIERLNMTNKNDRFQKINSFLDKVRREKHCVHKDTSNPAKPNTKENSIVLAKKYQNKIKIQQDIIDLQKIKLERQERLIMELKLNKILDDHKQSREEVRKELKSVIKTGDVKNRTKAKCLQLMGNLRDEEDEDEFSRLQGKALIMPKFLINMQERAMERNMKHEQAKQRRLQIEAEREAAKIAQEEAKRLEDEEAKQRRIEALKEKRRLEKLAKIEKERVRQRNIENNKKCQEYRRRWLLRSIGMEAFKRLIKRKRKFQKKAEAHRKTVLKQKVLNAWKFHVYAVWEHKNKLATNLCMKIVKRFAFRGWLILHQQERSKYLVAVDWYELKITEAIMQHWLGFTKLQKLIEDSKSAQAISHYNWNLRWKVLDHWRRLPQFLKIEKETEERRQRWRMKIWELLPDYKPNANE